MACRLTLVLGGVRSGKSAFAEELVNELDSESSRPALYLATGQVTDAEMAERIRRHRERRPAHWLTIEEPLEPATALANALTVPNSPGAILLDSLDVWVANFLLAHENDAPTAVESLALAELERLLDACRQGDTNSVLVSSEVGLSPVPPNVLGRRFQDLLGTVNQRAAAAADAVYLVVAGIPLPIKPQGYKQPGE